MNKKQKEQNELFASLFNTEATDEQKERIVFVFLIDSLVKGEIHELLRGAPVGLCEELGRIWDAHSHVPINKLFYRPKFEDYEVLNGITNHTLN